MKSKKKIEQTDDRLAAFFDCVGEEVEDRPLYDSLCDEEKHFLNKFEIARGGMKTIYSVFDRRTDRVLAMAKLNGKNESLDIEAFLKEARLTARLDHPNIIKVHDIDIDESGEPFFTMDLKTGLSLDEYIIQTEPNLQESLLIFLKICDALSYAHSKGVLHLDIKPSNIQIGEFGEVMVCDWGLAVVVDSQAFMIENDVGLEYLSSKKQGSTIKGTPGFMSPEQIKNEEVTERTDIFSLGVILYFLLSQKYPFNGDVDEVLKKTLSLKPVAPSKLQEDGKVTDSLDAVVNKAMAKQAGNRYQSIKDLSSDINFYLSGFATEAENASFFRVLSLMVKRHKMTFSVIFTSLMIITTLIIVFFERVKSEKNIALFERDRASQLNDLYVQDITEQSLYMSESSDQLFLNSKASLERVLALVDKAIEANPSATTPKYEKGKVLFIMQRYEEAYEFLNDSRLKSLCKSGIDFTKDGDLSHNDFYRLIKAFPKDTDSLIIMDRAISFYMEKNFTKERLLKPDPLEVKIIVRLIKHILHILNPDWDPDGFRYEANNRHVLIIGNIRRLKSAELSNPVHYLFPLFLKLRETEVSDFEQVILPSLKTLDIRGSRIASNPTDIRKLVFLNELLLRPDQYVEINGTVPRSLNLIQKK